MKRNDLLALILFAGLGLLAAGCEVDGTTGGADARTASNDTTSASGETTTSAPPAAPCTAGTATLANTACEQEGQECRNSMQWCGGQAATDGCDCVDGAWRCWSAAAPLPCDSCCEDAHGPGWTCDDGGTCQEPADCTGEECCPESIAGLSGEPCAAPLEGVECRAYGEWCGERLMNAMCTCQNGSWGCSTAAMPMPCHDCCQTAHDEGWFCNEMGDCVEAAACNEEACCVPGPAGDTHCQYVFGACSHCKADRTGGTCDPQTCP